MISISHTSLIMESCKEHWDSYQNVSLPGTSPQAIEDAELEKWVITPLR